MKAAQSVASKLQRQDLNPGLSECAFASHHQSKEQGGGNKSLLLFSPAFSLKGWRPIQWQAGDSLSLEIKDIHIKITRCQRSPLPN